MISALFACGAEGFILTRGVVAADGGGGACAAAHLIRVIEVLNKRLEVVEKQHDFRSFEGIDPCEPPSDSQ